MKFLNIFPISILGKIVNDISDLDIVNYKDFLLKQSYNDGKENGESTISQKVLEDPIFYKLKNNILELSRSYLMDQGHIFEDVQIASSWGNKVDNHEHIYTHVHPNSYLSGVFYFDNDSPIKFVNPTQNSWKFKPKFNQDVIESKNLHSFNINPKPKLLLIFPSFLPHSVPKLTPSTISPRFSIAFNIIPKGEFGEDTAKLYL